MISTDEKLSDTSAEVAETSDNTFNPVVYPMLHKFVTPMQVAQRKIVGREHEIDQLLAAMHRPELCNALLLAPAGSGKSHPNDTLIPVNDSRGYIPIGDIIVGDEVFDHKGNPVRVSGVFPQGKKRVFEVIFEDGSVVECSDEHLWDVRSHDSRKRGQKYLTKSLRQIIDSGLIRNDGTVKWSVPKAKGINRKESRLPLHPYALGALLGDGCLGGTGSHSSFKVLSMSSIDEFVVNKVSDLIGAIGIVKSDHNYSWKFLRKDPYISSRGKNVKYIQRIDLDFDEIMGVPSRDRYIPVEYFSGSLEQRLDLLRGLFDTDGSITNDDRMTVSFSTKSKQLAHDVSVLLSSVGYSSNIHEYDRANTTGLEYEVIVYSYHRDKKNLFSLPRHLKVIDENYTGKEVRRYHDDLRIVDVIDTGVYVNQTCIMVDSPDHLYQVTKNHIVTHNTALVQATSLVDVDRVYMEIDLARMISGLKNTEEMAAILKTLFDEAEAYTQDENIELVLFIDEFHQIVQLSDAAVEALKPILAASGTRGIRVIAATTYEEFHRYISENQPLVERLQRINVSQTDRKTTVAILRGMAERYGVSDNLYDDSLFDLIYEYTNRYIPASSQPRKSILLLDSMVGWHRLKGKPLDKHLLAEVLKESTNVDVAFNVDATSIKSELDKKVFAQDMATRVIARRLQLCVADLQDKSKPMSSFLFTGSTGVGKTEMTKQLAQLLFGDDNHHLIRFDMSEFALDTSLPLFKSELTKSVWNNAHSVLLFDEIEKASPAVIRLMLQMLDDGRLSDDNNRTVSFLNTYIVLTTNAGSEVYQTIAQYAVDNEGSGKLMGEFRKVIMRSLMGEAGAKFPPELLGRIDAVVPFQPLSTETVKKIIQNKIREMMYEVKTKHGVTVSVAGKVLQYLTLDREDSDSNAGGARNAIHLFTDELLSSLAEYINTYPHEKYLRISIKGTLSSDDKTALKSKAEIVIHPDTEEDRRARQLRAQNR